MKLNHSHPIDISFNSSSLSCTVQKKNMKILFILLSTLILFSLIPLSFSDATFEIRSDIEVAIRLSLRPSPISIIMKNYRNADQFFKNFKNIITNLRPQMLTPPARDNIDTLEAITKINYQQSAKFFNNDYMTIWYNKMRRFLEANYVFTNMYEINDKFLQTMTSKKAPRCWNRFRENVKNVTQYYVVTAVYKKVEDFLFNKFSGYKNESLTFLEGSKKIGPGNSASFFVRINLFQGL
ncbi:hypothetical protein ACKWTF_006321 [Chironomus riparius]